ncbi:ribosome maturation factor RimM [Qipengyuania sp. DGS5-3]|uniref:ribosome maturation factor RimM n=1 Tax=Qipengyuania sp. DGS5-3 TaxID=3349632 RepID=UPI0036D2ADBB
MTDTPVTLAAITGAHGVTGEVRLKLFGEGWEALKAYRSINVGKEGAQDQRALTLKKVRSDNRGGAVARFVEVTGRGDAEKLRGSVLSISRKDLPELEEGEFYYSDLMNLAVVTDTGEPVGRVLAVANYGASEVVEIEKPDGKKFMVPLSKDAVPSWDEAQLVIAEEFWDR